MANIKSKGGRGRVLAVVIVIVLVAAFFSVNYIFRQQKGFVPEYQPPAEEGVTVEVSAPNVTVPTAPTPNVTNISMGDIWKGLTGSGGGGGAPAEGVVKPPEIITITFTGTWINENVEGSIGGENEVRI